MKDEEPQPPDLARRVWNFAVAAADFACDGFVVVDEATYQARLAVCDRCELRQEALCTECGCYIKAKAAGRAWSCPIGRWDVPDISVLPQQLQFTLLAEELPPGFGALVGTYLLERQPENDIAAIGHFGVVWQAFVPANTRGLTVARLEASERGATLRFFDDAGQASPLVWQRTGWTIPFLFTGPMPLEPASSACTTVTLWPG